MIIYGLYGKSHGAAYALTLMSAAGASAVASRILPGPDVLVEARVNQLPQYFEKREGALSALVDRHRIVILNKTEWDEQKAVLRALLGEGIWR